MTALTPTVSVVITTYNRVDRLRAALHSITQQTFTDYEIIVVDDGSTADVARVVFAIAPQSRVILQPNSGVATARNVGIAAARGQYIAFLDDDDQFMPAKLSEQVAALQQSPQAGLAYNGYILQDEATGTNTVIPADVSEDAYHAFLKQLAAGNIMPSQMMVPKAVLDEVGLFDPQVKIGEDAELVLRITRTYPIIAIDRPLTIMTHHPGRSVLNGHQQIDDALQSRLYIIHKLAAMDGQIPPTYKRRLLGDAHGVASGQYLFNSKQVTQAVEHLLRSFYWLPFAPALMRFYVRHIRDFLRARSSRQ